MKTIIWKIWVVAAGVSLLAIIAPVAGIATADSPSPATGVALTHKQILQIALSEARSSADPRPERIEMATGPLKVANSVMDPQSTLGSAENGEEVVDLVVMYGHFKLSGPHPRHRPIAPSKVVQLVIGAYNGFVEIRSTRAPLASLSRLGPVTRLR